MSVAISWANKMQLAKCDIMVGFLISSHNYALLSPCHKLEGKVVQTILNNVQNGNGPLVSSQTFSSEVKIQIKPTEKWGSCHSEHDGGYVNIQDYQEALDLTKALYFDVYHENANEKYCINYKEIDVDLD